MRSASSSRRSRTLSSAPIIRDSEMIFPRQSLVAGAGRATLHADADAISGHCERLTVFAPFGYRPRRSRRLEGDRNHAAHAWHDVFRVMRGSESSGLPARLRHLDARRSTASRIGDDRVPLALRCRRTTIGVYHLWVSALRWAATLSAPTAKSVAKSANESAKQLVGRGIAAELSTGHMS